MLISTLSKSATTRGSAQGCGEDTAADSRVSAEAKTLRLRQRHPKSGWRVRRIGYRPAGARESHGIDSSRLARLRREDPCCLPVRFPDAGGVADTPAQVWNAWHQWKAAVETAKSTEIDAVVDSLEKAAVFAGPAGEIRLDPACHRNIQNVHLAKVTSNQTYEIIEKFEHVMPTREVIGAGACDLVGKDSKSHKMINPQF